MTPEDDPLYTLTETAEKLKANDRTMERWRTLGTGPAFTKIGRRVYYRASAIRAYLDQQTITHTSESQAARAAGGR